MHIKSIMFYLHVYILKVKKEITYSAAIAEGAADGGESTEDDDGGGRGGGGVRRISNATTAAVGFIVNRLGFIFFFYQESFFELVLLHDHIFFSLISRVCWRRERFIRKARNKRNDILCFLYY